MIELSGVSYSYPAPVGKTNALTNITETIKSGIITAIIGRTGSGKSTLMEIIGGITRPDSGTVSADGTPVERYRKNIGMVFQYPEYQLFAETVYDDIAFGPKNLGLAGAELDRRVKSAAYAAGLTDTQLKAVPFELSGGQKRMAALAGILAMNPAILLLDEPAAGLDPQGRRHVFEIMKNRLSENPDMTIVFVTHSMEDAACYADDIIVLANGTAAAHGTPAEIFSRPELLRSCGLDIPEMTKLRLELEALGISTGPMLTDDDAFGEIMRLLKGGGVNAS